jgi:hypothetical protein
VHRSMCIHLEGELSHRESLMEFFWRSLKEKFPAHFHSQLSNSFFYETSFQDPNFSSIEAVTKLTLVIVVKSPVLDASMNA